MISETDIQGHWVRDWIKAPGFNDHTTRVHWMQVGPDYADVRVPLDRPDLSGATCLAELSPEVLLGLSAAEGFAGHVTLEEDQCTWHREINWHGVAEGTDIGTIRFDAEGRMIEEGVEAAYTELWVSAPHAPGEAMRVFGHGHHGVLVTRGAMFVLGIGTHDKPASGPLLDALRGGDKPEGLHDLFDGLHAIGHWDKDGATATLATQPFAEGQVVVERSEHGIIWHRIAFDGTRQAIELTAI